MSATPAFRLVTFNLLHDAGSWPARAPLVTRQLAALAPDVVALQEVGVPDEQTGPLSTALSAAMELTYEVAACELHRPDGWSEGLAVLSSFPVEGSDALAVDGWGNVCLWVRLRGPGARAVNLYNLHLNPHRAELRRRQIAAILAWMDEHPHDGARILCGDFNAVPDGGTVQRVRDAGFASAHAERHGADPARTFPTPLRPDVYERRAGACLDFVFVEPSLMAVRDCRVALDQPDPSDPALHPSDHAGIVADLLWRQ